MRGEDTGRVDGQRVGAVPADLPVTCSTIRGRVEHLGGKDRVTVVADQSDGSLAQVDVFAKDQGDVRAGIHTGGVVDRR